MALKSLNEKDHKSLPSEIVILTVEAETGKSPDVGFSIQETKHGIQVGIYVSDASALIDKDSQLDRMCRDECLQIDDYSIQMLPPILE
jgi:exoribonuclease R